MSEEETIAFFDVIFNGKLSQEEVEQRMEQIKSDDTLRKRYEEYQNLTNAIKIASFRSEVGEVIHEKKRPVVLWISGIAASLLFMVGFWFVYHSNQRPAELYEAFYTPYPNIFIERGQVIDRAFTSYSEGNHLLSIDQLNQLNPTDTVSFYLGQNFLAMEEHQSAVRYFEKVSDSSVFRKPSIWYASLSYLAMNKLDSSKNLLIEIKEGDYKYREARLLLEKMDH
ncbi:MAG: hypothetical protein AAF551_06320 [Bacteroidota bacterium]